MSTKLNIDDVLNDTREEVQTFKKAEKKAKILKQVEESKKEVGRPTKTEEEKAKKRVLYYTDEEWSDIEKIADLYSIKPTQWIKMIVSKELKRETI